MPLPLILAGAGIAAGLLGIGGHASAKEVNEQAQQIAQEAKEAYDNAVQSLECAKAKTTEDLTRLGMDKKDILDHSMNQFLTVYERIKDVMLSDSQGLNELSQFHLDHQDVIQIQEMSEIYSGSVVSGVSGAAAGSIIALAASGYLPIVSGTLSVAGSALAMGEIGVAASLAGSALSFGAVMTPLAAVAAPVVLFTGISASMKADENYEKAMAMSAEADAAVAKMEVAETLCKGISERANMYQQLLHDLNAMFVPCVAMLDGVTRRRSGFLWHNRFDPHKMTTEEKQLAAVTRALAGAIKAVIDVPLLEDENTLSVKSQMVYEETKKALPAFSKQYQEIKETDYRAKPVSAPKAERQRVASTATGAASVPIAGTVRQVLAVVVAGVLLYVTLGRLNLSLMWGLLISSAAATALAAGASQNRIFVTLNRIYCGAFGAAFVIHYYIHGLHIWSMRHFLLGTILFGFAAMVGLGMFIEKSGILAQMIVRFTTCAFFYAAALLVMAALIGWFGIYSGTAHIITCVLLAPFAFIGAFMPELDS